MSQRSVTSYFNSRKRAAADDLCNIKSKQIHLEQSHDNSASAFLNEKKILSDDLAISESKDSSNQLENRKRLHSPIIIDAKKSNSIRRRSCLKRSEQRKAETIQPKIVKFTLAGALSPKKKIRNNVETKLSDVFENMEKVRKEDTGMQTPTKEQQMAEAKAEKAKQAQLCMSFDDVKQKIIKSSRLKDLKESLNKLHAMEENRQRCIKTTGKLASNFERDRSLPNLAQTSDGVNKIVGKNLKQFQTIELEVLSR